MSAPGIAEPANFVAIETVGKDVQGSRKTQTANDKMVFPLGAERMPKLGKVMLVGTDDETILARRLRAAGCEVITVQDGETVLERARREFFNGAVLVARGSLINVTETIFNLRDINPSIEVIVVLDRGGKNANRYVKQLLSHPIAGTQVLTRRQLQDRLKRQR